MVGCSGSRNLDHSIGVSLKVQLRGWAEGRKYVADGRNSCARFSACSVLDRGSESQARAQGDGSQPNPRAGKKLNRSMGTAVVPGGDCALSKADTAFLNMLWLYLNRVGCVRELLWMRIVTSVQFLCTRYELLRFCAVIISPVHSCPTLG